MEASFEGIFDFLKNENIEHQVFFKRNQKPHYQLASLKKIINNGIYYLEKEFFAHSRNIFDSLLITNAHPDQLSEKNGNVVLQVKHPQIVFYKICRYIAPDKKVGIHPTAIIDPSAVIGPDCYIGPYAVIGKARIEGKCYIDAHVIIGDNVVVKSKTWIEPNSYIGANGVAWTWDENGNKIIQPQFGGVVIEENCFIGSDVSIVRGSVNENTIIGCGTLISHGSKIGHGSELGEKCHLANNVSLAGNSVVEKKSFLGSASVISSHVRIGESSVVGAGAVVTKSFIGSHLLLAGVPAKIIDTTSKGRVLNGVPKVLA